MAVYTVHEPPPKRYETSAEPERFAFVRDGFSLWACIFGPLWMLRHRMWLVFFGYILLTIAIEVAVHLLRLPTNAKIAVGVLLALLIGFEAGTLRRFTLGRRKWTNVGVVVGDDLEAAERRFFDLWVKRDAVSPGPISPPPGSAASGTVTPRPAGPDVIGLFPQPGVQR